MCKDRFRMYVWAGAGTGAQEQESELCFKDPSLTPVGADVIPFPLSVHHTHTRKHARTPSLLQADVWEPMPFLIYGVFGVASAALMLLMPETRGQLLSQTIEEAVTRLG